MLAITINTIDNVANYKPGPLMMIKSPSLPTLMDGMAPLTSCFEPFTWAGHGSHFAAFMSCVSIGRMTPYNSKDGVVPKTAPSSGRRCASRLGKVRHFVLLQALSALHSHDIRRSNGDLDIVTNTYSFRADSHVLYVLVSQVSQRLDSSDRDQRIRS